MCYNLPYYTGMENTTMELWEVKGFQSSAVKSLFVGKTANGQDCIGCAWDAYSVYVYAYEGIVDTFMYYMERYNSVGKAMAFTKLKDGMEEGVFFKPCPATTPVQNQWYRLRRYDMMRNMSNIVVHQNLCFEAPQFAVKCLVNDEVLSGESSHFVACMTNKVTA